LALAERYDAYIIEDDYVSGLDFENMGFATVKSMDNPTELYFSKVFPRFLCRDSGLALWLCRQALKVI